MDYQDVKRPILPAFLRNVAYPVAILAFASLLGYSFAQAMY
ncbi:MAG: hypothetical protein RJQ21_19340 [Rhodospirillales bacterium]